MGLIDQARAFAARYELLLGILAFVAGFGWDALTLTRVDRLTDNLLLLVYLVVCGVAVALHHRVGVEPDRWPRLARVDAAIDFAARFCFGGLFSAYVVFYFKSAGTWPSRLFVVALVALMLGNEFRPGALRQLQLRVALFALCTFSFLLFFLPVATGQLGRASYVAALALAVAGTAALAAFADGMADGLRPLARRHSAAAGVLLGLVGLDAIGVIPPVPLALVDRGVYHAVEPTKDGYLLTWQATPWRPWTWQDDTFYLGSGDAVVCFSAVFAPSGLGLRITHEWQRWDGGEWKTSDRIPFQVLGGRDGGFRGYSRKHNVAAGEWRVRVVDEEDRELGRCAFVAEEGEGPPGWRTRVAR